MSYQPSIETWRRFESIQPSHKKVHLLRTHHTIHHTQYGTAISMAYLPPNHTIYDIYMIYIYMIYDISNGEYILCLY